jgi:hypothetical protein
MALLIHGHHTGHRLQLKNGDGTTWWAGEGGHRVELTCLQPVCGAPKSALYESVPSYLIGAVVVIHHSYHEGHPLELKVDGRLLHKFGETV